MNRSLLHACLSAGLLGSLLALGCQHGERGCSSCGSGPSLARHSAPTGYPVATTGQPGMMGQPVMGSQMVGQPATYQQAPSGQLMRTSGAAPALPGGQPVGMMPAQ